MLRDFLSSVALFDLPLIAMGIFVAFFLAVLLRVSQRSRKQEYAHMASLPLEDDHRGSD